MSSLKQEKAYTLKELVAFGNYLLSPERVENYSAHPEFGSKQLTERLSAVNDADISSFFSSQQTEGGE